LYLRGSSSQVQIFPKNKAREDFAKTGKTQALLQIEHRAITYLTDHDINKYTIPDKPKQHRGFPQLR